MWRLIKLILKNKNYIIIVDMCLFKVFIEKEKSKELIAEGISIVKKEIGNLELYDSSLNRIATIKNVEIVNVDSLNEVLTVKEY